MKPTYWIFLFLGLNLFLPQWPSDNPNSRLGALAAFADTGRFAMDRYAGWTIDWARGPDGHIYSNKAPGPMLVGVPVFLLVDHFVVSGLQSEEERVSARRQASTIYNATLSFLFQALPFALLVFALLKLLERKGLEPVSLHYAALALLFGNTASLLMNVYFGHAMAAVCLLEMGLAIAEERWFLAGLGLGGGILCDYGGLAIAPVVALCTLLFKPRDRGRRLAGLSLGLALPVLAAGAYYTLCFGRPWRTALLYEAPQFVDSTSGEHPVWGMFAYSPHFGRIARLLFGPYRGILFTQPWLLVTLALGARLWFKTPPGAARSWRETAAAAGAGFLVLLWMNGSFFGWHGGSAIGPRYLSIVFPLLAALSSFVYDRAGRWEKALLWAALIPALALCILVFSTTHYPPERMPLWPALVKAGFETHFDRFFLVLLAGIVFFWGVWIAHERKSMETDEPKKLGPL